MASPVFPQMNTISNVRICRIVYGFLIWYIRGEPDSEFGSVGFLLFFFRIIFYYASLDSNFPQFSASTVFLPVTLVLTLE